MNAANALKLLQAETLQVVGCTEPVAIAFAFRTLWRHLPRTGNPRDHLFRLRVSNDAFRNASTAVVPHIKKNGILAAAAAGLASAANDFNVFSNFNLPRARALLDAPDWLDVIPVSKRGLYVHLRLDPNNEVLLQGRHNHIASLTINGKNKTPRPRTLPPAPSLADIYALAAKRIPRIEAFALDFIQRQVPPEPGHSLVNQVVRRTVGRMTGFPHPVMTITGSGNQGIFLALPYIALHKRHGDAILPALVFSLLTQIHLSHRHSRLSARCGLATKAAPALAAGIAFHLGAPPAAIRILFREIPARLGHIPCDGAEPACGEKARQALSHIMNLAPLLPLFQPRRNSQS